MLEVCCFVLLIPTPEEYRVPRVNPGCCFVLLIPTPEEYRVPRVNPGVTASKLFPPLLPSLATPGPPLPYRPLQKVNHIIFSVALFCNCTARTSHPVGGPGTRLERSGRHQDIHVMQSGHAKKRWVKGAPGAMAPAAPPGKPRCMVSEGVWCLKVYDIIRGLLKEYQ